MVRKKTAKDTLTEAFRELAAHRPVDRITIRGITEKCGYSPATFYRNFRDKYDLIAWEYSREVTRIMNQTGREGCTWKQTLSDGLDYFELQKEYLSNLLLHTGGHDSFVRYMQEINYESLRRYIHGVGGSRLPDKRRTCISVCTVTGPSY